MKRKQQEQIGFMVMWAGQWREGFELKLAQTLDRMELNAKQRSRVEEVPWLAHMALRECEALGLDASLVLSDTLIDYANEYRAAQ